MVTLAFIQAFNDAAREELSGAEIVADQLAVLTKGPGYVLGG